MATASSRSDSRTAATTCFIAVSALGVAMGIGRFAATPMLPLMVREGTLQADLGSWLAACNYLGYLAGALFAGRIRLPAPQLMAISLVGTAIATAAMGGVESLSVWLLLRFVAGVMSAWTLVATSAWAMRELTRVGRPRLAGVVYSGVGLGIAVVGLFCMVAMRPNVPVGHLWLELGVLAATIIIAPVLQLAGASPAERPALSPHTAAPWMSHGRAGSSSGVVICYGLFGFGYILPATFLPTLAREIVDDPMVFGVAWPVFGATAAVSTVAAARLFDRFKRLHVWACCHLLMAAGVVLPTLWLSLKSIAISAVLVGGTFMVITMLGLQEARSRSPADPTTILGRMTAAFALGQLAGPLTSGALDLLSTDRLASLNLALQAAAIGLALSAVALLWLAHDADNQRNTAMDSPTANPMTRSSLTPQGFGSSTAERVPLLARDTMSEAQRLAADAIIAGPRKALFGPFVPLLQSPALMEQIGKTGEALRFQGHLPEQVRELTICVVARETSNQFEWQTHAPLAVKAGVAQAVLDAIHVGRHPKELAAELETTVDFVSQLMQRSGVADETYAEAVHYFGESGVIELAVLVGYFVMVCWVMNIARTPGLDESRAAPLTAFPQ